MGEPVEVYYTDNSFTSYKVCEWSEASLEDEQCSNAQSVLTRLGSPDRGHNVYLNISLNRLPEACTENPDHVPTSTPATPAEGGKLPQGVNPVGSVKEGLARLGLNRLWPWSARSNTQ